MLTKTSTQIETIVVDGPIGVLAPPTDGEREVMLGMNTAPLKFLRCYNGWDAHNKKAHSISKTNHFHSVGHALKLKL